MKDKTGMITTDFLYVAFIQFSSNEKNGTRTLTPGKTILKLVLKHAVGRQNYGAQRSVTYWCLC